MSKAFKRLPRSVLQENDGHRLFDVVANHIRERVERPAFAVNLKRLQAAPPEAQAVYWLWLFQCEAGGGGIEVFVLNHLGVYAPQTCAALEAVGATELVRRLRAAVPHARESLAAEFGRLENRSWFENHRPVPEFPTLQSVDKGVYPIIGQLSDAAATFIKSHPDALFAV